MSIVIKENMDWPPSNFLSTKMKEHSAWYSGDPNLLANYYHTVVGSQIANLPYTVNHDLFWSRQVKNDVETGLHVPIAGDIASTSADLLFSESPMIKIAEAHKEKASKSFIDTQEELDNMLSSNGFYMRILECAETCAAIGGGYIKLAWDEELSKYPIPVVEQADGAIPYFRFGILVKVIFWKTILVDGVKYYRILETYDNKGNITYTLYKGTSDKLGNEIELTSLEETKDIVDLETGIEDILCVFIPNMLPNRYNRDSYMGRSDYAGIEGLMDSLDETFSSWMRDILVAQGRINVPESWLEHKEGRGFRFNVDKMVYSGLSVDPVSMSQGLTATQFAIRADEFEKTSLNLLDRIISSAGYSPQSFGLNISGRAESGTALNIRERKSFSTKNKKESYWDQPLKKLVSLMLVLYSKELKGTVEVDSTITVQYSDSLSNDINETSSAIQKIAQAFAASTETKVKMLHPDWSEAEVKAETDKILLENDLLPVTDPDTVGEGKFKDKKKEGVEE